MIPLVREDSGRFWPRKNLRGIGVKYILISIMVISMSGCTSTELVVDMYQSCKYRDKCPVELVSNWLNGK